MMMDASEIVLASALLAVVVYWFSHYDIFLVIFNLKTSLFFLLNLGFGW